MDAAEAEAFAEEVKRVMDEDGHITAGYLDIYKNAQGNYLFMALGFICACIRGLELPALALIFMYVFEAFTYIPWGSAMMHRLAMAVIIFCSVGLGVFIFQLFSVSPPSPSRPIPPILEHPLLSGLRKPGHALQNPSLQ